MSKLVAFTGVPDSNSISLLLDSLQNLTRLFFLLEFKDVKLCASSTRIVVFLCLIYGNTTSSLSIAS